jgi:hypothetical protein
MLKRLVFLILKNNSTSSLKCYLTIYKVLIFLSQIILMRNEKIIDQVVFTSI